MNWSTASTNLIARLAVACFALMLLGMGRQTAVVVLVEGDTQTIAANTWVSDWPQYTDLAELWEDMHERACAMGVGAVLHTGDVVNNFGSSAQWDRADRAFDVLDACGIQYSITPGNHDFDYAANPPNMSSLNGWRAARQWRHTKTLTVDGNERAWVDSLWGNWSVGVLTFSATQDETQWLAARIAEQPAQNWVVLGHEVVTSLGRVLPTYIRTLVRDAPNVRLLVGGHYIEDPRVDLATLTDVLGVPLVGERGRGLYSNFQGPVCAGSSSCGLSTYLTSINKPPGYLHGWVTKLTLFETGKVCASPLNLLDKDAVWNAQPECLD